MRRERCAKRRGARGEPAFCTARHARRKSRRGREARRWLPQWLVRGQARRHSRRPTSCVFRASAKLASASLRPRSIPHRWSEARGPRRPHAAADTSCAPSFPCQPRPPQAAGKNSNRALHEIPPRLQPCTLRPPEHTATPVPASTTGKARQQSWRRTSRRETCEVTACARWLAGEHRVGRRWTPLNVAAAQGLRPSPRVPRPRGLPRLCAGSPPCAWRIAGRLCPSSTSSQT